MKTTSGSGGIYAETFAVWQVIFVVLSLGTLFLVPGTSLLPGGIVLAISLVAVCWPVRRGIKWSDVREDIGLTRGKGFMEFVWGVVCYVSALPLLVLGLLMVLALMTLAGASSGGPPLDEFAPVEGPSHPIVHWLSNANVLAWIQAFVIACVVAPVVEETMFRGVLNRHLRDATAKWRIVCSVVFSCFFNALIFAAIHPQGWIGIPLLASLAFGFSLAREWRGSLIAPMTMHALNNGIVLGVLLLLTM